MKDIAVITRDRHLARKIALALSGISRVEMLYTEPISKEAYDLVLYDTRGERALSAFIDDDEIGGLLRESEADVFSGNDISTYVERGYVPILWREDMTVGALPYPFSYDELFSLLDGVSGSGARLALIGERTVRLDGEKIKLSEVEYRLLSLLHRTGGEYLTREELVREVWGEGQDEGVLNVYIHYLRSKLEGEGERIILSSRKSGYRLNKDYLGGENA